MQTPSSPTTVSELFFHPTVALLPGCQAARVCHGLPDEQWLLMSLTRVLHDCKSGRAFLQEFGSRLPVCPDTGAYFESIKSPRRLRLLNELNAKLQMDLSKQQTGTLAEAKALKEFDVFAGDGHWHGAAVHDPRTEGTKHATGHFYGINLRTHGMVHLTGADQQARRHEHDMRALKRLELEQLRQNAPKGRKVIWVWDRAGIDFQQWHRWKTTAGIYFISRSKENMKLTVYSERWFDAKDPVNVGVLNDQSVGTCQGVMVRRVIYQDPVSGECFEFLTTEQSLAPGWIAHLYRLRWDIEKVFDQFKNKLSETKSWASSPVAKQMQAQLLCLAHNLMLLFEQRVLIPAGVRNHPEDHRRAARMAAARKVAEKKKRRWSKFLESLLRCTQVSVKFIRWLRAHFFSPTSCTQALDGLRSLYAKS